MMYRLAARESSDGNFLLKFWVIFVAITEFVFCLSKASRFIDLSAREAYFIRIFYQGHVILRERKNFRVIFFPLFTICFYLVCLSSVLYHARPPRGSCWNFIARDVSLLIFRAETSVLVNKVGVLFCSITGFSICSRVCQKRFLTAKVWHYFHIQNNVYWGGIKVTMALKRDFAEGFPTVLKQLEVF